MVCKKIDSLEKKLSKFAALDGFSINQIYSSDYLRASFERDSTPMPKSRATITSKIFEYHAQRKASISKFISQQKKAGKKFSVAADEWTSYANKRFMNVFVHSETRSFNIGLVRIRGSANAENLKHVFFEKLLEFGLLQSDIVSLCTDGAAVMLKLGKQLDIEHLVCFLHTLNLIIVENLYTKSKKFSQDESSDDGSEEEEVDAESLEISIDDYKENVILVRKIVRLFKVLIFYMLVLLCFL